MADPTDKDRLIALISAIRNALIPVRHALRQLDVSSPMGCSSDERIVLALEGVQTILDFATEISRKSGGM